MGGNVGSNQNKQSATRRLGWLGVLLFAIWSWAPGCSCDDPKPGPTTTIPDVGVDAIDGDAEDTGDDTDEDADADVPEDVDEDVEDVEDVEDADEDVDEDADDVEEDAEEDVEDIEEVAFLDSCLFPIVACLGEGLEPVSCTRNPLSGVTAVSYGTGRASQWQRNDRNRQVFEAYVDGDLCYTATALDERQQPFGWDFVSTGPDTDTYSVTRDGDTFTVFCPDDSTETYSEEEISSFLPQLLDPDDELCTPIGPPRCEEDSACQDLDQAFECCDVAGTARCLVPNQCPEIPDAPPELDSCLTPMLDCFGNRHVVTECRIDPNFGETVVNYTRERRAVITDDGFNNYTVETSSGFDLCYLARMAGDRPWESIEFADPISGQEFQVSIEDGVAQVTCADDTQEEHPEEAITQYIPFFLDETEPLCEVAAINVCNGDGDCEDNSRCCETLDGNRCLAVEACPEIQDPWDNSCMRSLFDCFGDNQALAVCVDYGDLDITEVAYVSGARATFFEDRGQQTRRTFFEQEQCFEAVVSGNLDGFEVLDLSNDDRYLLEFDGNNALITCPDNTVETVPRNRVDAYLPARPGEVQCNDPVRDDECTGNDECGEGSECCDVGDRNLCLVEGSCEDNTPREACTADDQCGNGETCCEVPNVRVCNPRLCGNNQICCSLPSARVCGTEDVCQQDDVCDPGDPGTCDEGTLCCPTINGTRCLDVDICPDLEDPWGTSCLFGTFECFGNDLELNQCTEDQALEVVDVEYTSGAEMLFYNTAGRIGRRTSFGGQPCFNAIEVDENTLEVEDLLTEERFVVAFDGANATITCPGVEPIEQVVPSADVRGYLPIAPAPGTCDPRDRNDLCNADPECLGDVCCDIGDRNQCLTEQDCERSTPRQTCVNNGSCGGGEVCCELDLVNVCDVALCGEQLCCAVPAANVCAEESECNAVDECDPLNPVECGGDELCCTTDVGNRCVNADICPDQENPIETSCMGLVLGCFGRDHELDSCQQYAGLGIVQASYSSGGEATFFDHFGQQTAVANNGDDDCYQLTGDGVEGYELFDLLGEENYLIEIEGPEARLSCPGERTSVVPLSALRAFLPPEPEIELCDVGPRDEQCTEPEDCDNGAVCCDLGDRTACLAAEDCEQSTIRTACENTEECGGGDAVCCPFGRARICDPIICEGELCCDRTQVGVCATTVECAEQVFDECDEEQEGACGDDALACCPTANGTRCLEAVDGECPGPLEGTCVQQAFECFGVDLEFGACVLREELDETVVDYVSGARNVFTIVEGEESRVSSRDGVDCFEAVARENGFDMVDLADNQGISLEFVNNTAIATCEAGVDQIPLDVVQAYLPAPPAPEECTSPEIQWQESCLFSLFECSGSDLSQLECSEYSGLVDRTDVTYADGVEGVFFNRAGQAVLRTSVDQIPCFEATSVEGDFEVSDILGGENYQVAFIDGQARITCPDDSINTVDAAFVEAYLPERPAPGACEEVPRENACEGNDDCGDGQVCCDFGTANACSDPDTCFETTPQTTCNGDDTCGEDQFCCERAPVGVCDPAICGAEVCCQVESAQVCGTEGECNGIFDVCQIDDPGSCQDGASCCETLDGNRCFVGNECPDAPDPIEGSCIQLTLQCFGRDNALDSCVDYGDLDRVDATYFSTANAVFYTSFGQAARRTGFGDVDCFDAFGDEAGGFAISDLNSGEQFAVAFDGPQAVVTCSDDTQETYPADALRAYFPERPIEGCQAPERNDECQGNADCDELGPGLECCDGGDRNICAAQGTCPANAPHTTCEVAEQCGDGQECCSLGGVRICDPTVCGEEICCNVFQAQVCGDNQECNTFADVCEQQPDNCPDGTVCCATNNGNRCFDGIGDQNQCPPVDNPWEGSCLFDVLECAGADLELTQCVDLGESRLSAAYTDGVQIVYSLDGELEARDVSASGQDCYEAVEALGGEGGFDIVTGENNEQFAVRFAGNNAQVTCSDNTILNVPRQTVEAYFPVAPVPEQCEDAEEGWRSSCLFTLFECFGDDNELDICLDYGELDFTDVDYTSGNTATFFTDQGVPVSRTGDVNQQPCFRAEGTPGTGLVVTDLLTSELYQVEFEGDLARITCPDNSVDDVQRNFVEPYVPERPDANACDPFIRTDLCDEDNDCNDGFVCCNLGDQNFCTTRETCEQSRPRPTCEEEADCGEEGAICCDFGPTIVCDGDICGDQPCCSVQEAAVCASEAECNGIFDLCDLQDAGTCGNGESCCETAEGNRCLVGDQCPPPPDPLAGTCVFDLFQCFGRFEEVDSCVDYGDLDMTEVTFASGNRSVYYNDFGVPARIAGDNLFYCFEVLEDGDNLQVRDLDNGDVYSIALDGFDATITCPDNTLEEVTSAGVRAYLPERPDAGICQAPERNDECQDNDECAQLDPSLECCDTGDRNICATADACRSGQVRTTCADDAQCGDGEACCQQLTTRVCNPSLCGNDLCCDVAETDVCATNTDCNQIIDVCEVGNNATCPDGRQCCDSNVGARCVDDGAPCEPVEDLWPDSCMFELFECFGRDNQLAACFDFGNGGPTEATFIGGARSRYFLDNGVEARLAGNANRDCFQAIETDAPEGGFVITDVDTDDLYDVTFVGDAAQITCPDTTVVNVTRETIEAYLPARPTPLQCESAEQQWQQSCLFGTFECFGTELEVDQCSNYADLNIQQVSYASGSEGTFFVHENFESFRTRNQQGQCFDLTATEDDNVFAVQDLVTGESFQVRFDDDTALITCPGEEVQAVLRSNVEAYIPGVPDPCAPAERNDECVNDAECGDPQLVCCDTGDRNQCLTRDNCARSGPRTACTAGNVEDGLEQGTCQDGNFCCETGPVRICDPAVCGDQICCSLEEAAICGSERDCAGIVDVCSVDDPGSCAPGSVCCPSNTGLTCLIGDECPDRDNLLLDTCMGPMLGCFGTRDFESCEVYSGLDRTDSFYSLGGEVNHFSRQGANALLTLANDIPCYLATEVDGGFEFVDSLTGDAYGVQVNGNDVLVTCPDEIVQVAFLEDLEPFVPARPENNVCDPAPRNDQCQNDGECGEGTVCCEAGDQNLCLTAEDCFQATPRPTCQEDTDCGEGTVCCEMSDQRICDPVDCDNQQVCCDVPEVLVCGTPEECAGIFDVCDPEDAGTCGNGETCCPTDDGTRCLVGDECPNEPDPVLDTCLGAVFECANRDNVLTSCVDFSSIDRTEAVYESGDQSVFFTFRGADAQRVSFGNQACFQAIEVEGGLLLTDQVDGGDYGLAINGDSVTITCQDNTIETVSLGALVRWLPVRPDAGQCQAEERNDECQIDAECVGLGEVCCDTGLGNACLRGDECLNSTPRPPCEPDPNDPDGNDPTCAEGTQCCLFSPGVICNPLICGDQVCCSVENAQVCATEGDCLGEVDLCDVNNPATCANGEVCCPDVGGTRCLVGDACPEPPDEVILSCIGNTLECFGRDRQQLSCEDFGALDRTEVTYDEGSEAIFFERGGRDARRAISNGGDCYDAVTGEGGELLVRDLANGNVFSIAIDGDVASVTCEDGVTVNDVPATQLARYMPERPGDGECGPADRNDECANDAECGDPSLTCCDVGDRNLCLTAESCTRNAPQSFCFEDGDCAGDDQFCCEQTDVRICDPEICGTDQPCCTAPVTNACGDERRCNGIVDLCDLEDAGTCGGGETCCETLEGNRCLVGNECPEPPDPIVGTCLEATFSCFGRDNAFDSCVDYAGNADDLLEVNYAGGAQARYFTHRQQRGVRTSSNGTGCFAALEQEGGAYTIDEFIVDENGPSVLTHTVSFDGPQATITCANDDVFEVPSSAVRSYLLEEPDAGQCQAPVRDDECTNDGQCVGLGEVCCDLGDRNACLRADECLARTPRPVCVPDDNDPDGNDPTCAENTICCGILPATRVCDPLVCGDDVCCDIADVQVCATESDCIGVVDICDINDANSCADGEVCCPTEVGNRCQAGDVCEDVPDPVLGTCLATAAECFAGDTTLDSCVDYSPLDRTEATFVSGSTALYYNDAQDRPVLNTTDGQLTCYEAIGTDDGVFEWRDPFTEETHVIELIGDQAVITCEDQTEFSIARAAMEVYLPARPLPGDCDPAGRNDECADTPECQELDAQLECCDVGDQNICATRETCVTNAPRQTCVTDDVCGQGEICCNFAAPRVCDPEICGEEVCCNPEQAQVCATAEECNGVVDFCEDNGDCLGGESCCETLEGNRCLVGDECPGLPDPLDGSCVQPTLGCFGLGAEVLSCEDFDGLGLTRAVYNNDSSATFFVHNGDETRRTASLGDIPCYEAVAIEGGGFQILDINTSDAYQIAFNGDDAQITCPDNTVETVPVTGVLAYLPSRPVEGVCDAAPRNDECQANSECQDLDPQLVCCNTGLLNECLPADTCAQNSPRPSCDEESDCANGEICCDLAPARVCDPAVCGEELCCTLDQENVCATQAECDGVLDFCQIGQGDACAAGSLCCPTEVGNRCLIGNECPAPPDPVLDSCVGGALVCFGNDAEFDSCVDTGEVGIIESNYSNQRRAQFFTQAGRPARRAYLDQVPCYNATEDADGNLVIEDALTQEVFVLDIDGDTVNITCADNSSETLPTAAFEPYFPDAPDAGQCQPFERNDDCQQDSECVDIFGPNAVCCDTGLSNACTDGAICRELTPQPVCETDADCGEGVGCCQRDIVTVCDPIVCNGQLCCDVVNRSTCGGSPEACLIGESCLGDTLECFGEDNVLEQCFDYGEDIGVLLADYSSGASAMFFETEGQAARRTRFDVLPCFQAVETTAPSGYEILNLQNGQSFQVVFEGEDAAITCADNQQETVPAAAINAFFPAAPQDNQCQPAERDDECQVDADCADQFGPEAVCCDSGVENLCLVGVDCQDFVPLPTCEENADCPNGTGCCEIEAVRVCDPAQCGDDICCNVPADNVCSDFCLLCENDNDCSDGDVCCPFTNSCTAPLDCAPEPECDVDTDCADGLVCCKAGQSPICTVSDTCPDPCRSDSDCGDGRICCGDQDSPFGAHCSPAGQCGDDNNLACNTNSDCGNGELCCRTLDEPACVTDAECPVACVDDGDCGNGQECCNEQGRTPICVPGGTCQARLGESCQTDDDCFGGLTCCNYDQMGTVCMDQAFCDTTVPALDCANDTSVCDPFPLATCCEVGGVAQCSVRGQCDTAFLSCTQDVDCGASGFQCCEDEVNSACIAWTVGCEGDNPF